MDQVRILYLVAIGLEDPVPFGSITVLSLGNLGQTIPSDHRVRTVERGGRGATAPDVREIGRGLLILLAIVAEKLVENSHDVPRCERLNSQG
jgi:hypothetical protein